MRRAAPIRDGDIFEVAVERFWDAPGGNDAGVKAVVEFCRNVFLDRADDAMREAISDFMLEHVTIPGRSSYDIADEIIRNAAKVALQAADAMEGLANATEILALLKEAADFVQPFNRAQDLLDRIEAAIAKATVA